MHFQKLFFTTTLLLISGLAHAECNEQFSPGTFVFPSDAAASTFLNKLKIAVSNNDTSQVAQLINFPLSTNLKGKKAQVTRATFSKNFSEIFNKNVRSALASADFRSQSHHACVFWNASGMMVGNGEIWFSPVKGGIKVIAINN